MKNLSKLFIAVIGCELVGLLSTPFTISSIPSWYAYLNKPPFSPPNWIFGPVWIMLYFLMGVSAFLIWEKGLKNKKVKRAQNYFFIQLFFNFFWSVLFFGLHFPILGLIDIVALLISILFTSRAFFAISKLASSLLLPYLLWVSFATILNIFIVILNR